MVPTISPSSSHTDKRLSSFVTLLTPFHHIRRKKPAKMLKSHRKKFPAFRPGKGRIIFGCGPAHRNKLPGKRG